MCFDISAVRLLKSKTLHLPSLLYFTLIMAEQATNLHKDARKSCFRAFELNTWSTWSTLKLIYSPMQEVLSQAHNCTLDYHLLNLAVRQFRKHVCLCQNSIKYGCRAPFFFLAQTILDLEF